MSQPTESERGAPSSGPPRPCIRWWPVTLILSAAAGAIFWVWGFYGRQHQDKNLATGGILVITILLLTLWCLLLSRMRWRVRLALVGCVLVPILLVATLFRIHGVTGDLLPVLSWRWAQASWTSPDGQTRSSSSNLAIAQITFTNDYPQFLGPNRDGTVKQPALARDWQAQPPVRLWLQPVGIGWSGFAVMGNRAVTQEQRGDNETINCYDVMTGVPLWSFAYPAHFQSTLAGEGPRATPTLAGNRVYAQGSSGILNCLDLETGKVIWSKDTMTDNQARVEEWGVSCSPLLVNDLVVVSPGGHDNRSLVAYRAANGEFVWGGGSDGAGYSSPIAVTLAGTQQILIFNSGGVRAHDPASGVILWKYPWPGGHPHVSVPTVLPDDRLLVSSGYGVGSELLKIQQSSPGTLNATRIWKSTRLKAKFTNVIHRDGYIYGLDDGIMVCLDATTGQQQWKEGRYGHGQEILVGDLLLVVAESGEVILLEPDTRSSRELARFPALHGKTWNPPALAGEFLLVRNDKEAACYRLPVAKR